MSKIHILVVEDEVAIAKLIEFTLTTAGFSVQLAENIEQARSILNNILPDVLLLDWMLPSISGVEYIRQLRGQERTQYLPIILLTARGEDVDKEYGLNVGADDYITKPFSPRELIARVNALLRRLSPQKTDTDICYHGLLLNPITHTVEYNEKIIDLGPSEFKLLHFFMTHVDRVYSRQQLLDYVWGDHVFVEERTIDVYIRRLRKGLEIVGLAKLVQTVRGSGYRFSNKESC